MTRIEWEAEVRRVNPGAELLITTETGEGETYGEVGDLTATV